MSLSNFPKQFDNNQNLYLVHDYLRLKLAEDYSPGDTTIYVSGDKAIMSVFPNSSQGGGIITLVDQCNDIMNRAVSFSYTARTPNDLLDTTSPWFFEGVKILPNFNDVKKFKGATNVCQNVMAEHHNSLKDALINIQRFAGIQGKIGTVPYRGTMEERINYLRKLILGPRAWFSVNKNVGLSNTTFNFKDLSFSLGTDTTDIVNKYTWCFNLLKDSGGNYYCADQDSLLEYEKTSSESRDVEHTYITPGYYAVSLTVENEFGSDVVIFENLINIRETVPREANINIPLSINQFNYKGSTRASVGSVIQLEVSDNGQVGADEIVSYTWNIPDDLNHFNNNLTKANFSVGGKYNIGLRVDTKFGNYRITSLNNALDIVEKTNLWFWTINDQKNSIRSHEFGIISETFKTLSNYSIEKIDDSFIRNVCDSSEYFYGENCRVLREFNKNNGFCKINNISSGDSGSGLIYWASGRSASANVNSEKIFFRNFNGFTQTYSTIAIQPSLQTYIQRPWNWIDFASENNLYISFGLNTIGSNLTSDTHLKIRLDNYASNEFILSQYINGADDLKVNTVCQGWAGGNEFIPDLLPTTCEDSGATLKDYFSVNRSIWKDGSGYILRNQGQGKYFRFRSFYKTSGIISNEFTGIKKINDLSGPTKSEGQLVSMSEGIFLFNNSGSISVFNTSSSTWSTGGPGTNSSEFRSLQDVSKDYFDNNGQTLLASSDQDHTSYLSYDYSENSFIKFNDIDLTFKYIGSRPTGTQWQLRFY